MQETRRKRIVISLDQNARSSSAKRKRKGWSTFLAVAGVMAMLLLAVIVGGFFWFRHYETTPPYSLALLVDAAQRNDAPAMNQYLDVDKIVTGQASEVIEKIRSRYGVPLNLIDPHRLDATVSAITPQIKEHLHGEIEKTIQQFAAKQSHRPVFVNAMTLPYAAKIDTQGDVATVTPSTQSPQLTMQRNGSRWKVVGIKDDALVTDTLDAFVKDLPAIGQPPGELPLLHETKPRKK